MGRYDLPTPKCKHVAKGRVFAGAAGGGPHAACQVCDRPACIEDAKEWAFAMTHQPAQFVRFSL